MANLIYTKAKEGFLDGSINFMTDNIKALLVDTSAYTVDAAAHGYLSDVPSGARIAMSSNLDSKTVTGGVADAADVTLPSVSGSSVEAIVILKDTGSAATSRLIAYIDTGSGLPFTPNSGDVRLEWSTNGIFGI